MTHGFLTEHAELDGSGVGNQFGGSQRDDLHRVAAGVAQLGPADPELGGGDGDPADELGHRVDGGGPPGPQAQRDALVVPRHGQDPRHRQHGEDDLSAGLHLHRVRLELDLNRVLGQNLGRPED